MVQREGRPLDAPSVVFSLELLRAALLNSSTERLIYSCARMKTITLSLILMALTCAVVAQYFILRATRFDPGARVLAAIDLAALQSAPAAKPKAAPANPAIERTRKLVDEIRAAAYPELRDAQINIETFEDRADYFRSSFSFSRYLLPGKMRYRLLVNPRVFESQAPDEGVRAILAHELGHTLYFAQRSRIELLGLVRLAGKGFTARFERWADLQAIARGYGEGLKAYREWLYRHVPVDRLAEKRRNYFSPEEIDAILAAKQKRPERMAYWLKHVPLNLREIQAGAQ